MSTDPPQTRYHRWIGWYAPALRRALVMGGIGLSAGVVLGQPNDSPRRGLDSRDRDHPARRCQRRQHTRCGARTRLRASGERPGPDAPRRACDGHDCSVVDRGEHCLHLALRRPALQIAGGGFGLGDREDERPNYRDFAYPAFTIGMTYQVSDTAVRDARTRRTVLAHAILAYVFGVVIVAGSVNLIAVLAR
jgi:hypothetical protein